MFKASINAGRLKEAIGGVTRLVDEGKFNIRSDGLALRAVDPADAAMVILDIDLDAFEEYSADGETEIGIDLERLEDILGVMSASSTVSMELSDGVMELRSDGLDYKMTLPDPSSIRKEPTIPDLDLKARVTIEGKEFRRAVKAAQKVSDHIVMRTEDDTLFLEASGDSDSLTFEMGADDLVGIESEEDSRSLFSLDYLDDMSRAIGKAEEAALNMGTDLPIIIDFELAEGVNVEYLLAPRIESG